MKKIDYVVMIVVIIALVFSIFFHRDSYTAYIPSRTISFHEYINRIQDMVDRISHRGMAFIQKFEGLRLKAYQCSAGVWTIGFGTTRINGRPVTPGQTITKAQAVQLFQNDLARFESAVKSKVEVDLEQPQFDALVSFVYNVGEGNFSRSTLLKKLNEGDYEGAAKEFPKWRKSNGRVVKGLERRREAELELFSSCIVIENVKEKEECQIKEKEETKTLALDLSEKPKSQSETKESDSLDS